MKDVFEYSKHKALWQYMAERATIMKIVGIVESYLNNDTNGDYEDYDNVKDGVGHIVGVTKSRYIINSYHEVVASNCYACEACEESCYNCPIKIGRCFDADSYYDNYIEAITDYIVIGGEEYIKKAHKYAIDIAMAGLDGNVIVAYGLEVK